jgi:threonine dehydratase
MVELYRNILEAHAAIRPQVAVTPLQHSTSLSAAFG